MTTLAAVSRLMGPHAGARGGVSVIPGAFDAMQALAPAYALIGVRQLVTSATYTGYAYRAQRTSDNATLDVLPDTTALTLAAWGQAAGAAAIYGIRWYDQSGNGNTSDDLVIGVSGTAPVLDCSVSTYPVMTFNGSTQRISWIGTSGANMRNINTTAVGITLAAAVQPLAAAASTTRFAMMISQASGNTTRTSIDFLTAPNFNARTQRGDGNPFSSNAPTTWNLNPNILMNFVNYPTGFVRRYINGTAGTQTNFTSLPSPAFAQSGGVFIGGSGNDTTSMANMRGTCFAFYNSDQTANVATLEAAMEAAA